MYYDWTMFSASGQARTAWLYNTAPVVYNRKRPETPSFELTGKAVPLRKADKKDGDEVAKWSWARSQYDGYSRSRPQSRAITAPPRAVFTPQPPVKRNAGFVRQRPQSARPASAPRRKHIQRPRSRPRSSPVYKSKEKKEADEPSSFDDHRQCCCDLDSRRSQRVQRSRPWTIGQISPENHNDPTTGILFRSEIEKTRWISEQTMERSLLGPDVKPPRLVIVSSNIKKGDLLVESIRKQDDILLITYDFETWTFEKLLESIRKTLEDYRHGSRAKSILFYCQGGPGYLYLLRNRVLTPQKLGKKDQADMRSFFKRLGDCMSKLDPSQTVIHVMGCFFLGNKQGYRVFEELHKLMLPNSIRFESPPELSVEGKEVAQTYFDLRKYKLWRLIRQAHFSNAEWFKELQCKVPESLRERKEERITEVTSDTGQTPPDGRPRTP